MRPLTTKRLRLRPFTRADLEAFAAYRSDPEVARYQSWTPPYTMEEAEAFFAPQERATPGAPGVWSQLAIERRDTPGILGDCAFQVLEDDPKQAQIGVTLSQAAQGHGYATEAISRLLDHLLHTLGLHRVTATCDAENDACARLLERVGMQREAHFVENIWFKGAWGSEYVYAIRGDG